MGGLINTTFVQFFCLIIFSAYCQFVIELKETESLKTLVDGILFPNKFFLICIDSNKLCFILVPPTNIIFSIKPSLNNKILLFNLFLVSEHKLLFSSKS